MWSLPFPPLASLKSQETWDRWKNETCSGSTGQETAGIEQGTGKRHKGMTWPGKEKLQGTEREEQNELTLHLVGLPTLHSVAPSTHKLLCTCTFCLPFYSGRSLPSFASSLWMALTEALSPSPSISMLSHTGMYSVPPYLLTNIESIIRPACVSCCKSETVTKWKNILYVQVIPTPSFYCTKAVHWQSSSSYWSVAYIVVESISLTSASEYYFHVR